MVVNWKKNHNWVFPLRMIYIDKVSQFKSLISTQKASDFLYIVPVCYLLYIIAICYFCFYLCCNSGETDSRVLFCSEICLIPNLATWLLQLCWKNHWLVCHLNGSLMYKHWVSSRFVPRLFECYNSTVDADHQEHLDTKQCFQQWTQICLIARGYQ